MKGKYKVTGMSCGACSARVERAVKGLEGVSSCSVNLLTGDLCVEGDVDSASVKAAVMAAGYGIAEGKESYKEKDASDENKASIAPLVFRLTISCFLSLVLMYFSMGHMIGLQLPRGLRTAPVAVGIIQMLIAAAVMVINQKFFINGAKGLIHRAPNMDTLVSLGSLASFGYSVYVVFAMCFASHESSHLLHELYFEAAAMILTLITVGKLLEERAKGKTTDAIRALISLAPKTATVIQNGKECTVDVSEVRVGDIFIVRAGERIPADAEVTEGTGAVDEAMLTGESLPVEKDVGAQVSAATILKSGYIICRAIAVGEDTAFSEIIRMVKEASGTKAPIAKLADKVAGVFVPFVMCVSLLTFLGWIIAGETFGYAIARAVSVLVISCPCALGLATPVAIMVGSGTGARKGILFKSAVSLELMGRVKTVLLDKTGTVTTGVMSVKDVVLAEGVSEEELLSLALTLEMPSEHPIAEAIVKYASEKGVSEGELSDFETQSGIGVLGTVNGTKCRACSYHFAKTQTKVDNDAAYERLTEEGKTPVCFIKENKFVGMLALSDTVKSDAREAVLKMKKMGISVVMLTGDNERTAHAVAKSVGVERVIAQVMPRDKEKIVKEYSVSGICAMVGDGINDAPALTRADVGIAIGRGTDVAIEAADVVLMRKGLCDVPLAIDLGRRVLWNIRENLFFAFLYNCIGIPMAMGLFGLSINPMFGALAMSLSSFSVVMNALRIGIFKMSKKEDIKGERKGKMETKIFTVEGMMCPHCEARVKKAVEAIEGVKEAVADHKSASVKVSLTADVSDEKIISAITEQGYDVK